MTATPAIAENEELLARISATPGVRRVIRGAAPTPPALPEKRDETATIPAPPGPAPGPAPAPAPATAPEPPLPAPGDVPERAAAATTELDAVACQRALDAVAAEPPGFRPLRATVNRRVALALDRAADVIRRCVDATIEVRGHDDNGVGGSALSERRARAAERYLRREGVAGRPLVAVGAGKGRARGKARATGVPACWTMWCAETLFFSQPYSDVDEIFGAA